MRLIVKATKANYATMSNIQIRKSLKLSVLIISSSASTGDRDPGLERSQPSQCCLRSVGQRGQELVQSWLWRNGKQTPGWPSCSLRLYSLTHKWSWVGLWPHSYFFFFFVSLCWDGAAITSKGGKISAWQRQAVDSGIYGGNTEVIFCRGVCSPCCRSSYTRVSNAKLCSHWWRPPFLFFERDQSGARVSEQICLLLF